MFFFSVTERKFKIHYPEGWLNKNVRFCIEISFLQSCLYWLTVTCLTGTSPTFDCHVQHLYKLKSLKTSAGATTCGEALRAHFLSSFVCKCITLSELSFFAPLVIVEKHHIFIPRQRRVDSGSVGFLISSSVSCLYEAPSEGQNKIHPNEKAIVDLFLHLAPPYFHSPRKHPSFFLPLGLMRLSGHTCALGKIPLLALKQHYAAQGHGSQCFQKQSEECKWWR